MHLDFDHWISQLLIDPPVSIIAFQVSFSSAFTSLFWDFFEKVFFNSCDTKQNSFHSRDQSKPPALNTFYQGTFIQVELVQCFDEIFFATRREGLQVEEKIQNTLLSFFSEQLQPLSKGVMNHMQIARNEPQ